MRFGGRRAERLLRRGTPLLWLLLANLPLLPARASAQASDIQDVFRDGFESGTLGLWHQVSGFPDISASAAAAITGTYGMSALVDGSRSLYVQDDSGDPAVSFHNRDASYYHASFRFDPNGFDPGEAAGSFRVRLFIAFDDDPQRRLFALVLRRRQGQFALMGRVRQDDGVEVDTGFHDISDDPHLVELVWHRSAGAGARNGTFRLAIDGTTVATLANLDTHATGVDFTRLGALSVKPAASGTLFWDDFHSARDRMAARAQLVINEVDYEQPGTDAQEFVEVYNRGPAEVELKTNGGTSLVHIDGATHGQFLLVHAPLATLAPGQYLVFATSGVTVAPGAVRTSLFFEQDNIGNGAPDGLVLVYWTADGCTILDALAYEGPMSAPLDFPPCGLVDFVEGNALPAHIEDSDAVPASLIRLPNGVSTGDHATDWTFTTTPTPGAANVLTP